MKPLLPIVFVLLLITMFRCPGKNCRKTYKSEQGFHGHLNMCKKYGKRLAREGGRVHPPSPAASDTMLVDEPVHANDTIPTPAPDPISMETPPMRSNHRFPAKFRDLAPDASTEHASTASVSDVPASMAQTAHPTPPAPAQLAPQSDPKLVQGLARKTTTDRFGIFHIWREYPHTSPPTLSEGMVADLPTFEKPVRSGKDETRWWYGFGRLRHGVTREQLNSACAPFANSTIFRLVKWFYKSFGDSSIKSFNNLVNTVLKAPDFKVEDIPDKFDLQTELKKLDNLDTDNSPFNYSGVWHDGSVSIPLPAEGVCIPEAQAPKLTIEGIQHRKLVEVIHSAFEGHDSLSYQYTPVKTFWKPTEESKPERIYGEVYQSNVFWDEHEKVMGSLPPEKADMPVAIAALMFYSDSTHVAQFGSASMWPCYVYFGNQSKYDRGKPSKYAAHHVAYVPTLPKEFQDEYIAAHNRPASKDMITHLKRELMQSVWDLLFDQAFKKAYQEGLVIKVLLSSIRFLAKRGCPEDLVEKIYFDELGTTNDLRRREHIRVDDAPYRTRIDKARWWIFDKGKGPAATDVNELLGDKSEVPVKNAFSRMLSPFQTNFFSIFVPDLLHEFELGVWKSTFTHLMRILQTCTENQVQTLNKRFREVPTFGRDTIRKFSENASSMKKMAARDFEDLLQCSLPVFEGLLPDTTQNKVVMDLLFVLACWHSCAKLRLHTERTVEALGLVTRAVGMTARRFRAQVCRKFKTRDLPGEDAARGRRKKRAEQAKATKAKASAKSKKAKKGKGKQKAASSTAEAEPGQGSEAKARTFNLNTFKFHALGHYVKAILNIGTTDSYSTQHGEQEHRRVKQFYVNTNKRRAFARQVARHYRRQRLLLAIQHKFNLAVLSLGAQQADNRPSVPASKPEPLPKGSPHKRYQMSETNAFPLVVLTWVDTHKDDPAFVNFFDDLRAYLLARLTMSNEHYSNADYTPRQLNRILFDKRAIYRHKVLRLNYTTYDMLRMQDSINANTTHCDVMLRAHESDNEPGFRPHPYWYARVIGVFHADITLLNDDNRQEIEKEVRVDFLWVRWFARVKGAPGLEEGRLPRCGFIDTELENSGAFGFVDPADVIRGVHMLPVFSEPRTDEFMGPSVTRHKRENDSDFLFYDVNIFADRDMFTRFAGGGPGHGTPLPYYPLNLSSLYAKPSSRRRVGRSTTAADGHDSENDIGRTAEEEEQIHHNEQEEYDQPNETDDEEAPEGDEEGKGDNDDPDETLGPEPDEEPDEGEEVTVGELGFGEF